MGEDIEQGLAAGDLNGSVKPAVGPRPLHGRHRLDALEGNASPQLGFEAPTGFVHAEVAQRLGGAEVLVHDPQQAWECFGTVAAAAPWLAELVAAALWAGMAASS